jgi:glutamine---fructose-6-phosphate transaminase (isomerizing)
MTEKAIDDLRRCSKCVLPETYPGIIFDPAGVCNHCEQHAREKKPPLGMEALRKKIESRLNSKNKWDAAVALSGGRDSTYAMYFAAKELKLKMIAFTIDQGLIPDETWESMANATKALGIQHVVVKHDLAKKSIRHVLRAWLKRPSPGLVTFMCLGCRLGMYQALRKLSYQYDLPLCITGNGEPEEGDFASEIYGAGETGRHLGRVMRGIGMDMLRNPRYFGHPVLIWRLMQEFIWTTRPTKFIRRITGLRWHNIDLYRYIPYDERKIEDVLKNELGWKGFHHAATGWRADCKVPLLKNAMYKKTMGFTKHDGLISGVIRRGLLTREEGLKRLANDTVISTDFIKEFFTELGLSYKEDWVKARWDILPTSFKL